ncbi:hypothetical protein [Leptospira dzoumogneensis]|uniref:DUF4157 domain-containing protein n=1 Tax=Leptospira dzoumogneensis TaxID=2484904 RepID=A0A4Z1AGS8_9LEPT|nr:hypothetical protein [Leptospira dzoumogneensis]TGM96691.1 hypothetical protein EHR06_16935 [Leptospira dzoumogneensis]
MFNRIVKNTIHSYNYFFKHPVSSANEFMHVLQGKGRRHERSSLSWNKINKGLTFAGKVMMPLWDPAFTLGLYWTGLNYVAGIFQWMGGGKMPWIEYRAGGYLMHNSPLAGAGVTMGPVASVPTGADEATIQHELAHVRQYNNWGGWNYIGATWQSPFNNISGKGPSYAERNADSSSGTNAYGGNTFFDLQFLYLAHQLGWDNLYSNGYINLEILIEIYTLLQYRARLIPL